MIRKMLLVGGASILALSTIAGAGAKPADKVTICHHTSSETNPVVMITISENALAKHLANHGGTGNDTSGTGCEGS